jgi:hypothetical protein
MAGLVPATHRSAVRALAVAARERGHDAQSGLARVARLAASDGMTAAS